MSHTPHQQQLHQPSAPHLTCGWWPPHPTRPTARLQIPVLVSADPQQLQELLPILAAIPADRLSGLLSVLAGVPTSTLRSLVGALHLTPCHPLTTPLLFVHATVFPLAGYTP